MRSFSAWSKSPSKYTAGITRSNTFCNSAFIPYLDLFVSTTIPV